MSDAALTCTKGKSNVEAFVNRGGRVVYLMQAGRHAASDIEGAGNLRLRTGHHHLARDGAHRWRR